MNRKKQTITKGGTKGKAEGSKTPISISIHYEPQQDGDTFKDYQGEARFFAHILSSPDCPAEFRKLFDATFTESLLEPASDVLANPLLLPIIYPIVRDVLDGHNYSGTADGVFQALIHAVEVLVPRELADAARSSKADK
jgi:hypothetical protein